MKTIDDTVIWIYTRIAHAIQRWIGWTSIRQAQHCAEVIVLLGSLHVLGYWFPVLFAESQTAVRTALVSLVVVGFVWIAHQLRLADREFHENPTVLPVWVGIVRCPRWMRLAILSVVPAMVVVAAGLVWADVSPDVVSPQTPLQWLMSWAGTALLPTLSSLEYLIEVDPLPPGQSKVKAWWTALRTAPLVPLSSEVPR